MFGAKGKQIKDLREQLEACANHSAEQLRQYEALRAQYGELKAFVDSNGSADAWDQYLINKKYMDEYAELEKAHKEEQLRFDKEVEDYVRKVSELEEEAKELADKVPLIEANAAEIESPGEALVALAVEIKETTAEIKKLVKEKRAIRTRTSWGGVDDARAITKIVDVISKLALRAYNAEAQELLSKVTAANYDTTLARLIRKGEQIEKLGEPCGLKIYKQYQMQWAKHLRLAADYAKKKALDRELEREKKAELREAARAQRELEAERARLEKEEKHYENAIRKLQAAGREDEVESLENELAEIRKGIANVDYRSANIRAGYVYVISNLGSFGERMVKIGMTRRLDPLDRIRELSDASVPFNFDVHALFFSEDAVGVEAELHRRFAKERVNLINLRREFFNATPVEVKDALADITGNLLEFVESPPAEQYHESEAQRASLA